jgi:NADH dehydrogenase/NADH:ubiquinone oxidoreductase subunit G
MTSEKNELMKEQFPLISHLTSIGMTIPHYCYHISLSIAGNCRMCLIEIVKLVKPALSCATSGKSSITNNSVYYDSVLVKKSRENVVELLLVNHPLDCPVCDQGYGCDLQDQAIFYGFTQRRFYKFKRIVSAVDLGSVIKTIMTRCIHCTRCVRFAKEIAHVDSIGLFGRGMGNSIGAYLRKLLVSELSGNLVELCPVASMTKKYCSNFLEQ